MSRGWDRFAGNIIEVRCRVSTNSLRSVKDMILASLSPGISGTEGLLFGRENRSAKKGDAQVIIAFMAWISTPSDERSTISV